MQRLYERLEGNVDGGTAFKKCIRLTEHEIDDHKVLQSFYDTPKDKDHKVFHIDVTSSVSSLYVNDHVLKTMCDLQNIYCVDIFNGIEIAFSFFFYLGAERLE